jgi:flagellar hook-associated protein 3 FlgL
MMFNRSLANVQTQHARLLDAQEEATSGKKVQRPSDDPVSTRTILNLRGELRALSQFSRNHNTITSLLQGTESALGGIESVLVRAKEIAISGANDTLNAEDRKTLALEVAELFHQTVQFGNTDIAGRYVFAGRATDQPPVSATGSFSGDSGELRMALQSEQSLAVNIPGSRFLASNLRPAVDLNTPLSSLRQGQGISPGSLQITDRAGNTAVIDVSAAVTVGDVVGAISGAAGINVTAALNDAGNGLVIVDDNAVASNNLTVAEIGGGTTASELGIAASRPGSLTGAPLAPTLTASTPLALLYEGQGVTLTSLHIANGTAEVDVDLSAAATVDDVLTAINASAANVTASLNADGTALDVRSNDPTTVAIVTDSDGGTTAADLGIQGSQDTLKTLNLLQTALEKDDRQAIDRLLVHIDRGLDRVLTLRGDVGARLHRVELVEQAHADFELSMTTALSQTEDTDAVEAISRLSQLSVAFQAALGFTARSMQPTLLDFLR